SKKKQDIIFIDPKGILMLGNFGDEKIIFCNETIKNIEQKIISRMKHKGEKTEISMKAFVLSLSKFEDIKDSWGERNSTIEDFINHNVLFLDDKKHYLVKIFENIF
ncbi:hypothetical protein, partial [Caldithrix abyssi]